MSKFNKILFLALIVSLIGPSVGASDQSVDEFLDMVEKDAFNYFLDQVNPENGLIRDSSSPGSPASIAATGFGLTAICIGESRGWIGYEEAYDRVLRTLLTFRDVVPQKNGFFYHFLNIFNGRRAWSSEVSSIDTALFLAGALFAGEYFKGTRVEKIAREIYERVDWPWMLNEKKVLCMGWKPERGFLSYYWDRYSEAMILYCLAIGSPTKPISPECWDVWERTVGEYGGYRVIYSYFGSLFTYLYSHAWIDFRDIYDDDVSYWQNSINAIMANREFCIDNSKDYRAYGENGWGLTACLGPWGYKGYGAKPGLALNDGTIPPHGIAGSIPFAPEKAIPALRYIYNEYGGRLYGKYGFKDAFNLDRDWWARDWLGIDQGIVILMIENYRTGMVWEYFMRNEAVKRWISLCFKRG